MPLWPPRIVGKEHLPWAVKYSPKHIAEVPQQSAASALSRFLAEFPRKRGIILVGPTGCCKTSLVYALANEKGLDINETNASDYRTASEIKSRVGGASKQASLFGTGKLILVDEMDGLAGNKDRGAIPALAEVISSSCFPIVLTAIDLSDKKYKALKKCCSVVELSPVGADDCAEVLARISTIEKIDADPLLLKTLARRSGGDLRGMLNDFQGLVSCGALTREAIDTLSPRDREESMQQALVRVLKNSDASLAKGAFDATDVDLSEALLWLEYNVGKEYTKPADCCRAFDALSRADVFLGRIRRWQHWHFLVYANVLMTAGVACAKDAKYPGLPTYQRTSRLLKIWMANARNSKRDAIAAALGAVSHTSKKKVIRDVLPMLKAASTQTSFGESLSAELDLDDDQTDWLCS